MEIINTTPYAFHPFDCSVGPTVPALSLIVKGTFKLRFGQAAEAVPEALQQALRGDEMFMDDLGRSLRYATDLVALKPRGEVMLEGACHVPDGRLRAECDAGFTVGSIRKTLRISGDRRWSRAGSMSAPQPFEQMPLRWERAFGSLASPENPMGRGVDPTAPELGSDVSLPNVEYPECRVTAPTDRPRPAGFGPVAPHWQPRAQRNGTRDQRWAAFRAPLPPVDYDARCQNAAPDDQQLGDGVYFRGDEPLVLDHMHPEYPRYESALPQKRLRFFLWLRSKEGTPNRFSEVELRLDTVFIDAEKEELALVWRRPVQVSGQGHPEIEAVYLAEEDMASEPQPADTHFARFRELRPDRESASAEMQAHIDEQRAEAHKMLRDGNVDPKLVKSVEETKDPSKALDILMQFLERQGAALERQTAALQAKLAAR